MKLLDIEFTGAGEVKGILFFQLFRFNDLCLYQRSDGQFEVVKARHQKANSIIIKGVSINYEEKEIYPKGENWGLYEYCHHNIDHIISRYNQQAASMNYDVVLKRDDIKLKVFTAKRKLVETDD